MSEYQDAFRSVAYINRAGEPTPGNRSICFQVFDGTFHSNRLCVVVQVSLVDDNNVTLSCSNSSSLITYRESSPAAELFVAPTLQLADIDVDHSIVSAVVELYGHKGNYEKIAIDIASSPYKGISVQSSMDSTRIDLQGSGKDVNYESLLRMLTYKNTASEPTEGTRHVSISVSDGRRDVTCVVSIEIILVNDNVPEVDLNGPLVAGIDFSVDVLYSMSGNSAKIAADAATVTDADGTIEQVDVVIYDGESTDVLVVDSCATTGPCRIDLSGACNCSMPVTPQQNDIVVEYMSDSYRLTLSSPIDLPPSRYSSVLANSVRFRPSVTRPTSARTHRLVQVTAFDGVNTSVMATTDVTILLTRSPPIVDLNGIEVHYLSSKRNLQLLILSRRPVLTTAQRYRKALRLFA